ncbi:type I-E CRISPR-associated protein Cas5/CasD [Tuanshanicoccus lijuaniae]|uniref:type I-E CRISPR-associated protein Cas5/CasD n=1 Tax=Aerococcaceae bacterium zg-1292 TaxID=2774330 RepID=UPI00193647DA|nr:type I-E CRISPR-associated protein Cas5/CasD [Aerococcaceae bacterium zg-1292]MBF6626146.1 type I-E CRISPR-associated protein Cas5/CasD [Aerococcaceae bacterium zg-BR9]MBF6978007.1 type I-E CRISPR-associated protein Cas5/CasD [Aerococcaceae bacterium zg-BR22]MBS4456031.1 type I-E CRISPR-associated protein Cas5/CasD [Aerococcaceae bacterium zg-A91]MBS4457783.1 type I-E CRISPR-associated protein Cas5/CasD [Aerococcaceae bacterium zg-BR33]
MKTIILKLSGPMQSYGTDSHFETRKTDFYPSKSAIVGLLGACMGLKRSDEKISELNDLNFAVRVDQPGKLLKDYHTAQKYKNNGVFERTYVTNRYYVEDAIFIVAIGSEDEKLIEVLSNALKNPYFQPYLGRKSLPINADYFLSVKDQEIIAAIKSVPWQARIRDNKNGTRKIPIYCDSCLIESSRKILRKDRVLSFDQKNRRFAFRYESFFEIEVSKPEETTTHDIFGSLGG